DDIGDARTQELGRVVHHVQRVFVAVVRGFVHDLGGDLGQIVLHVAGERGVGAGFDSLDRPRRDGGARRVGLEAAVVAALATPAVGIDGHVADLARDVRGPAIDLSTEHDRAAAARADREPDHFVTAPSGPAPSYAE